MAEQAQTRFSAPMNTPTDTHTSFTLAGQPAARGIAIGRAVLAPSSRMDVAHDFITPAQVPAELARLAAAREAVAARLQRLRTDMPRDTPAELSAMLDVHLMMLLDEVMAAETARWVRERHYNAEWAIATQLEVLSRQFDEMEDAYLRERKADVAQVAARLLRELRGVPASPLSAPAPLQALQDGAAAALPAPAGGSEASLVLIASDLSPADMLQFKKRVFAGFATDEGSSASHTAIVARSLDIPSVVGAGQASQRIRQDDVVIIDGDAGLIHVNPGPAMLEEYRGRRQQAERQRQRLAQIASTPAVTQDGQPIELLANIEQPADTAAALAAGAVGVGLLRSEFLFMGREGRLPDEEEQYAAYSAAVQGMRGLPVTIRTVDVGADKPLDARHPSPHQNPAMSLRAIRWSLSEPAMFLVQLRAILRAAAHGPVQMLIPMLAQRNPPDAGTHRQSARAASGARAGARPLRGRRDDRNSGRRPHRAAVSAAFRLSVHRHQRPRAVHPGHRPHRPRRGPPVRPPAPRRAAPDCQHHRRRARPRQARVRVRRNGGRRRHDRPAAGPGPAQFFHAPGAHPAIRRLPPGRLGAGRHRQRRTGRIAGAAALSACLP